MAAYIWVNIDSGNGLLPDGTKPLPETNVDLSSVKPCDISIRRIAHDIPRSSSTKISLKFTYAEFHWNLPMG